MQYIVTFEEKMRIGREPQWVEGSRIYEDIETARSFLEYMYSLNEGKFRRAHVWHGVEVSHDIEVKVNFEEDMKEE